VLWIKMFPAKCLRGKLHFDFPYTKRGLWYELLLMAGDGDNDGVISYPLEFLAGQLGCSLKVLESFLTALVETKRIKISDGYRIEILNWARYQGYKSPASIQKKEQEAIDKIQGTTGKSHATRGVVVQR